jgi:hypothetical protein
MRSKNQTELIERKRRCRVAPLKERKDALRNLGDNEIIFEDCQTVITHPPKTEIPGDVV